MPFKNDKRHMEIGGKHRALSRFYMICNRVKNTHTKKNKNYLGVKVLVEKQDFVEWFCKRDFNGCSVDRIDKTGNYELPNMQVISLKDNIAKDKLKSKDGYCECYSCHEIKPLEDFAVDKRRTHTGRSTLCKKCDNSRPNNESKEARERRLKHNSEYMKKIRQNLRTGTHA